MVSSEIQLHYSPVDTNWVNEIRYDEASDIALKVRTLLKGKNKEYYFVKCLDLMLDFFFFKVGLLIIKKRP